MPALSRAAANADTDRFRDTFSFATRLVILFTVPATVGLLVLAAPIVRLIFEQGRFGPEDTAQVAGALRYYALGLLSFLSNICARNMSSAFQLLLRVPLATKSFLPTPVWPSAHEEKYY